MTFHVYQSIKQDMYLSVDKDHLTLLNLLAAHELEKVFDVLLGEPGEKRSIFEALNYVVDPIAPPSVGLHIVLCNGLLTRRDPVEVHERLQVVDLLALFLLIVEREESYQGEDAANESFGLRTEYLLAQCFVSGHCLFVPLQSLQALGFQVYRGVVLLLVRFSLQKARRTPLQRQCLVH